LSDCLWNDLDAYLLAAYETDMGAPSAYPDLKLALVVVGEAYDPDWVLEERADPLRYPFCLVRGLEVNYGEDQNPPHGDGVVHYDPITYRYEIQILSKHPDLPTAKQQIQELMRRARTVIQTRPGFGNLQASDGETVYLVEPRLTQIQVQGVNGVNQGTLIVVGRMEVEVMSEI
jgi:hypothetical protein